MAAGRAFQHTLWKAVPLAALLVLLLIASFLQLRLLLFLLVSGALLGGHFLWLRRFYPSLAEAAAGAFLLSSFQILVSQMLLAAFGWLRWEVVYGLNLLLAVVLWAARGRDAGPLLRGAWRRSRAFWRLLPPLSKGIALLLVVATCWSALLVWYAPIHGGDDNTYHVPIAILRAQQGNLERLGFSAFIEAYPENAEFWILWTLLGTGSQRLADGVQLPFWLFGMAALFCLARRLGARPGPALIGAALWGLAPVALGQSRTAYNDLILASLFWLGLNFVYRRPARLVDMALAAAAAGLLLGIKYQALLFVLVLVLAGAVSSARDLLGRGWAVAALVLLLWLVALAPGLFWYLDNWHDFGNPVWPYRVSLGPLQFPGQASLDIEVAHAPPELQGMPRWRQLWTVWMENASSYGYGPRSGGLGPLWVILGLPALVAWLMVDRRAWPLVLICGSILALHTDPWWTRFVLFLPGLGGIALALVLTRVRPLAHRMAQVIFLIGALYSLFVGMDGALLDFFFLPAGYRTQAYLWPDLYLYRWFEANAHDASDVLCYTPWARQLLPVLAGEDLQHRLLPLDADPAGETAWVAGDWYGGNSPGNSTPPSAGAQAPQSMRPYRVFFPRLDNLPPWRLEGFSHVARVVLSQVYMDGAVRDYALYRVQQEHGR